MFKNVMENYRQATEATVHLQQEMFKKWISLWPFLPTGSPFGEEAKQVQKKWGETVTEFVKKQTEVTETQFKAGIQNIEKAFALSEAKSPEEFRTKSLELWQQSFDALKQVYEAQINAFGSAIENWGKPTEKKSK